MNKLYFMNNSKILRSSGYALGLLLLAFLIYVAPSSIIAEDVSCDDSSAPRGESASDTAADAACDDTAEALAQLSDEQLDVKMQTARKELIELRNQRHHARQDLAANDEDARAIVEEMNELRRQLREKNAELEALMDEDERFAEWRDAEQELAGLLRALAEERSTREQSDGAND